MVDTSLYPPAYQQQLLTLLTEEIDLDEHTDGVLIHSDNFQALNLLQARYREQVKCIYIDPPYNTGNDGFIYKDNYQHSSWLTTMENRLQAAYPLLRQEGVNFISIDDTEQARLKQLCDGIYGEGNFLSEIIWSKKRGKDNSAKFFSRNHEYLISYGKKISGVKINRLDISEETRKAYKNPDNDPRGDYRLLGVWARGTQGGSDYEYTTKDGVYLSQRKWLVGRETMEILDREGKLKINGDKVYRKLFLTEYKGDISETIWVDASNAANAADEIKNIMSSQAFETVKPLGYLNKILKISINNGSLILDYFAGSGTTAHAVINLNREDGGKRKYILVEQGEYFDTVLKPRVQKVIYSENWKNGKPQADEKTRENPYNGVSQIVKVLKLESYEDTLNNLQLKAQSDLFKMLPEAVQEDYLLRYLLDTESKGSLLNSDDFQHPFDYRLNIATDSAGAYQSTVIDLPETFNYLLGIRVQQITDEREKRGYLTIEGLLPNDARCLIVWRDCEKMGYAEVAQFFDKHNINPNSKQYDVIYLNGDHDMANQWQNEDGSESRLALRAIEPEFLNRMFAQ